MECKLNVVKTAKAVVGVLLVVTWWGRRQCAVKGVGKLEEELPGDGVADENDMSRTQTGRNVRFLICIKHATFRMLGFV